MTFLALQQPEKEWLAMRDGTLGSILHTVASIKRQIIPDPFCGLIHAISGQQISSKAHAAIWAKICQNDILFQPEEFLRLDPLQIRSSGLSFKKIQYIKNVAAAIVEGKLKTEKMASMEDDELALQLSKFPGIGSWTVEMLLIFTFKRPNVFSFGDLAIKKGLMRLHKLQSLNWEHFKHFRTLYSPCGTAASLCLWEIASRQCWPPTP